MHKTKIVVFGALGRMGSEIISVILGDNKAQLSGAVEAPGNPQIGKDIGESLAKGRLEVPLSAALSEAADLDCVIIDFTSPSGTKLVLEHIAEHGGRAVIGTTGLDESMERLIGEASRRGSILTSPNMSLGVNLLFYLTDQVSRRLGEEYDIEIVEAHHRHKKDSPSGTAKRLGEIAASARDLTYRNAVRNGREGIIGERTTKEIGMHAVRGGGIIGDHTVMFAGLEECIELRHRALSRNAFARGAVIAAKWLHNAEPGQYSMRHVLDIE